MAAMAIAASRRCCAPEAGGSMPSGCSASGGAKGLKYRPNNLNAGACGSMTVRASGCGWPPELLYNSNFWDRPRGLAAILDANDEIAEVTADYIAILKVERNIVRFQRRTS